MTQEERQKAAAFLRDLADCIEAGTLDLDLATGKADLKQKISPEGIVFSEPTGDMVIELCVSTGPGDALRQRGMSGN